MAVLSGFFNPLAWWGGSVATVLPWVLAGCVLGACVWLALRYWTRFLVWRDQVTFELDAAETYTESLGHVQQRATTECGLVRRGWRAWLFPQFFGIRLVFQSDSRGQLVTRLRVPRQAAHGVEAAWAAVRGVHIRRVQERLWFEVPPRERPVCEPGLVVRRGVYEVVALDGWGPLRQELPGSVWAGASSLVGGLDVERGESLSIVVDRGVLSPSEARREVDRRRAALDANFVNRRTRTQRFLSGFRGFLREFVSGMGLPGVGAGAADSGARSDAPAPYQLPSARMDARKDLRQTQGAEEAAQTLVRYRFIVVVRRFGRGESRQTLEDVERLIFRPCSLNRVFIDKAGLRLRLPFKERTLTLGPGAIGHRSVDRWLRWGVFPTTGPCSDAGDAWQLVGPPMASAGSEFIRRHVGLAAAPLEAFDVAAGRVFPAGRVTDSDGSSFIGAMKPEDVLMTTLCGLTGGGKTELALSQAVAIATHTPFGMTFIDPENGRLGERLLPLLHRMDPARPVLEINLSSDRVPAVNFLDMTGRTLTDSDEVVKGVVSAFVSLAGWSDSSARAQTLLRRVMRSLVAVNHYLCQQEQDGGPTLQLTIYSVAEWFNNDSFRDACLHFCPPDHRVWWEEVYPRFDKAASTVIMHNFDRLDSDYGILPAMLGRPQTTWDLAQFFKEGGISIISASTGDRDIDRLVTNLFLFHFVREARKRPAGSLRHFLWLDELAQYPGPSIPLAFQTLRKFGVAITAMFQDPSSLPEEVKDAVLNNSSFVALAGAMTDATSRAALIGVDPNALRTQPKYGWVGVVPSGNAGGGRAFSEPFSFMGIQPEDVLPEGGDPSFAEALAVRMDHDFARVGRQECVSLSKQHEATLLFLQARIGRDGRRAKVRSGSVPLGGPGFSGMFGAGDGGE